MAQSIGDIPGIGPKTEQALSGIGIKTIRDLANADIEDIASCGMSTSRAKDVKYAANQSTITIQTGAEVQEEYDDKSVISSGIDRLDEAIEGGYYQEAVISVWGESGSGKSQLCISALVEGVQQTGKPAIYIETEKDRFRPERLQAIADDDEILSKVHRVKAYSVDQQISSYDKVMEAFDEASIVVVDSLTARIRLASDFQGRENFTNRSSVLGEHLIKLEEMGERLECPVLFTNQAYQNPDQYGKKVLQYGGSKIRHTAQFFIHMTEAQGEMHAAEVQNHPSSGDTEVLIDIHEKGIDGMD